MLLLQYFKENPDYNNPAYNTKHGVYSDERCGLNNVLMSWGHDDYMYLVYIQISVPVTTLLLVIYHQQIVNRTCMAFSGGQREQDNSTFSRSFRH